MTRLLATAALISGYALACHLVISGPAFPHDAASGFSYPFFCCNGNGHSGDCQAIPSKTVRPIAGGYRVTLNVGDHRLVTRQHVFDVPQSEARPSSDGQYHICLYPDENQNRCFFAPPAGS